MARDLSASAIEKALTTRYVGRNLVYLDSTPSTMDEAYRLSKSGAPEGTVVIADEQTAGRGRFQRAWVSPKGASLLFSVVLKPELPVLSKIGMVASLAVVRAVRRSTGLEARIKWPNDVQISGKKLCGILIDSSLKENRVDYTVVGIGLNVNLDVSEYPEIAEIATSLSAGLNRAVSRLDVLKALLSEIEALYDDARRGESPHIEWKANLATLGQRIRVVWVGVPERGLVEEGLVVDADEDGALLLKRDDGSTVRVVAGEASLKG